MEGGFTFWSFADDNLFFIREVVLPLFDGVIQQQNVADSFCMSVGCTSTRFASKSASIVARINAWGGKSTCLTRRADLGDEGFCHELDVVLCVLNQPNAMTLIGQ